MAKGKYITEEKYRKIRALWLSGLYTTREIMEAEDVSEHTVRRCKNAETYDEFKVYGRGHHKKCNTIMDQQEQISFIEECNTNEILLEISQMFQNLGDLILRLVEKGERT
jgi:transposase